jgi:hypothetical protein
VIATIGNTMAPIIAPNTAYVNQLHGDPVSASEEHFVAAPTNFAIRTAIMPPPANPANAVKQPIPK